MKPGVDVLPRFFLWRMFAAAALALTAGSASAAGAAADELHAFLAQTTSARGQFSQTTQAATQGSKPQRSKGTFEFQRPGRFLWTYTQPYDQRIVADGQHLSVYDADLKQVTVKSLNAALASSPAAILFGANDFEHQFDVKPIGVRDGLSWYQATPKVRDSAFEKVEIGLKDALPVAMRLVDGLGGVTVLDFTAVERNPPFPADHFVFVPPPGADVLKDQ